MLLALVTVAKAQEMPLNQVYVGYELERPDLSAYGFSTPRLSFNGVEVSDAARIREWFGVEGNFGFGFKTYNLFPSLCSVTATGLPPQYPFFCGSGGSNNTNTFAFGGPRVQYSLGRIEPYGHFLLGVEHVHWDALSPVTATGTPYSTNAFAFGGGGGVVVHLSKHVGIAGGVDYIHASKNIYGITVSSDTLRVTAGPTFVWGGGYRDRMSAKASRPSSGETALPLLGVVIDSHRRIILFYSDSVLSSHGLELGDVITGVNDNMASTPEELTSLMSNLAKGATVKIRYLSRGQWQSWISIKL